MNRFPTITLVYTFEDSDREHKFTVQARSVDFAKADMYISLRLKRLWTINRRIT